MKKITTVLGVSLLAMGILGACSEEETKVEKASPEVQKAAEEMTSETETKEEVVEEVVEPVKAKLGETINVEGVKITVVDIAPFTGRINQFQPITEDHAVVINVIVENTNAETVYVDSSEFGLYDVDGFELVQALPGDENAISAEIPGGKKVKGTVYFDVPAQTGNWELHYTSMFAISSEPAVWEVPAK